MKRFTQATGGDMEEFEGGEWVRHEDVSAENVTLKATLWTAINFITVIGEAAALDPDQTNIAVKTNEGDKVLARRSLSTFLIEAAKLTK